MKDSVLIVGSDPLSRDQMAQAVKDASCMAVNKASHKAAFRYLSVNSSSLILLDADLPERQRSDAFRLISRIKITDPSLPILVVSEKSEDIEVLYTLEMGAGDYILKPFNVKILSAKIKALIRRYSFTKAKKCTELTAGPFRFDLKLLRFYKNGSEIRLTGKEKLLMKLFMENAGHVLTNDKINKMVWNGSEVHNSINVYVNRLRNKIEYRPETPVYLLTEQGVGYRFRAI